MIWHQTLSLVLGACSVSFSDSLIHFKKLWADSWRPRTEHILRNTLLALLELPQATLPDAQRLLADYEYRQAIITVLADGPVKKFWIREFEQYAKNFRTEAISPIQNKVGQFVTHPVISKSSASRRAALISVLRWMQERSC